MNGNLAMKLDTLSYAKKLIAAGCEPKLAEAHASLQQDVWIEVAEDYLSQFATKQDIEMLEQRIDGKFNVMDGKFNVIYLARS